MIVDKQTHRRSSSRFLLQADQLSRLAALVAALLDFHRNAHRILLGLHGNLQARWAHVQHLSHLSKRKTTASPAWWFKHPQQKITTIWPFVITQTKFINGPEGQKWREILWWAWDSSLHSERFITIFSILLNWDKHKNHEAVLIGTVTMLACSWLAGIMFTMFTILD